MYSEQLEQLIKSVIADGIITEKERTVLHKKAAAEGIDEDEIDVYVDGLLAKSDVKQPVKKEYDMRLFDKIKERETSYYQFQKFCKISSRLPNPATDSWIGFLDVVSSETERCKGLSIIVCLNLKKHKISNYPKLIIKTDLGTLASDFDVDFDFHINEPIFNGKPCSWSAAYPIDAEQLKMLAESATFQLSLGEIELTPLDEDGHMNFDNDIKVTYNNINCAGLNIYAQCFYREVVDKNAYPDAIIANLKTGKKGIECLSEKQKINLLFADKKQLNKIPSDISCYTQYLDASTHTIHTYIKDGKLITEKKLSVESVQIIDTYHDANGNLIKKMRTQDGDQFDYSFSLNLHAISGKDGNNTFFFEISSKYTGEYRNRFWGINESRLIITVGIDDYELVPIETNENIIRIKEMEHSFYELEDKLLKQLANAKKYKMSLLGNKDNKDNRVVFKNFGLRSDLCFSDYWKQAIALLENKGQGITSVEKLTSTVTSGENIIDDDSKSNIEGEYIIEGEKGLLSKYGFTKKTIIIFLVLLILSLLASAPILFCLVLLSSAVYAWLHRPKKSY